MDYPILLHKLEISGIRGVAHNLFESYLKNKFQQAQINCNLSEECDIEIGVQQGRVLGSNLSANDLFSTVNQFDVKCIEIMLKMFSTYIPCFCRYSFFEVYNDS